MRLEIGDNIYCKEIIGKSNDLTLDKAYVVVFCRLADRWNGDDICIIDDFGAKWWIGQVGSSTRCWTKWFISEKEWLRDKKLKELLDK